MTNLKDLPPKEKALRLAALIGYAQETKTPLPLESFWPHAKTRLGRLFAGAFSASTTAAAPRLDALRRRLEAEGCISEESARPLADGVVVFAVPATGTGVAGLAVCTGDRRFATFLAPKDREAGFAFAAAYEWHRTKGDGFQSLYVDPTLDDVAVAAAERVDDAALAQVTVIGGFERLEGDPGGWWTPYATAMAAALALEPDTGTKPAKVKAKKNEDTTARTLVDEYGPFCAQPVTYYAGMLAAGMLVSSMAEFQETVETVVGRPAALGATVDAPLVYNDDDNRIWTLTEGPVTLLGLSSQSGAFVVAQRHGADGEAESLEVHLASKPGDAAPLGPPVADLVARYRGGQSGPAPLAIIDCGPVYIRGLNDLFDQKAGHSRFDLDVLSRWSIVFLDTLYSLDGLDQEAEMRALDAADDEPTLG